MTRMTPLVLSLGLAMAGSAQASDHYTIIQNSDHENHPVATVDVTAADQTPVTVIVLGPPGGGGTATLSLSSADLFFANTDLVALGNGLESGQAKLVRCTSLVPVETSVMLHGDQGEVVVPPVGQSLGSRFMFPLGDLGKGVTLLIGNPNQGDIQVEVLSGTAAEVHAVPGLGVLDVPLTTANARYVVTGVGPAGSQPLFIAALVSSEKGRSSRMVMLPPFMLTPF